MGTPDEQPRRTSRLIDVDRAAVVAIAALLTLLCASAIVIGIIARPALNGMIATTHFGKAQALAGEGDYRLAIAEYTRAIQLNPDYPEALYWRGNAYYFQADYDRAIVDYTRTIELNPEYAAAYLDRGSTFALQADYARAKPDLERAIELDQASARAHNNLCWYGSLLGDVADVMDACERAVELEPTNPVYHDSRGLARALIGDYEGAIQDFTFYIEHASHDDPTEAAYIAQREAWTAELESGRNPFDEATLKELLPQ